MKHIHLTILFFFLLSFISCKKNSDEIFIRVQNATTDNFLDVQAADTSFGNVNGGAITGYKTFVRVKDNPNALLITATDTLIAGYLSFNERPYTYLTSGKYTLQIFIDTLTFSHYNAKYTKE